jgi:WD40 repeat protein
LFKEALSRDLGSYQGDAMPRFLSYALTGATLVLLLAPGAALGIPAPPFDWGTLAFTPDGRTVASALGASVALWDAQTGKRLRTYPAHPGGVRAIAFSPDGRVLASGGDDNTVRLWDTRAGKLQLTLSRHGSAVRSLAFAPDGRMLASVDGGGNVCLWEVRAGALRRTFAGHGWLASVAFSPDGRTVATSAGPADAAVRLWDVRTGGGGRIFRGGRELVSVAFSPDGHLVAGAGGGQLTLWDARPSSKVGSTRAPSLRGNVRQFGNRMRPALWLKAAGTSPWRRHRRGRRGSRCAPAGRPMPTADRGEPAGPADSPGTRTGGRPRGRPGRPG